MFRIERGFRVLRSDSKKVQPVSKVTFKKVLNDLAKREEQKRRREYRGRDPPIYCFDSKTISEVIYFGTW